MKFIQRNSNTTVFCEELRRRAKGQAEKWSKVLRINVVISSTTAYENYRISKIRTWAEWLHLAIIHWYLPKEALGLVHLELEESSHKFGTEKGIIAQTILSSEPEMVLLFLETSSEFKNERDFFGFLLDELAWEKYHFYTRSYRKPKRTIRRRGYNDKGSRRLPHQLPANVFVDWTKQNNEREEDQDETANWTNLTKGGIT